MSCHKLWSEFTASRSELQNDGDLPSAASNILHQHVIQGDLSEFQVAVVRWRCLFEKVRCGSNINFKLLHDSLRNLEDRWNRDGLFNEEVSYSAVFF